MTESSHVNPRLARPADAGRGGQLDVEPSRASERRPRVLLGHAGPVIAEAAKHILEAHGFEAEIAVNSRAVERMLARGGWDALVVDVALPPVPGYELTGFEMTAVARTVGVKVVILVASVFRRTSYKRQPRRLYGADDYVEIHHLGDHLPSRLRKHLGLEDNSSSRPSGPDPSGSSAESLREVLGTLNERGDEYLLEQTPRGLAMLIVADLLLYNCDRITEADSVEEALAAVASDLDGARDLFGQVRPEVVDGDPIGEAFRELVAGLERTGEVS
jgi:DNA-binding response OmpR family regulator